MPWFAAKAIMYFKWKDAPQTKHSVWENVLLIEAPDSETGWRLAEEVARRDEGDSDGSLRSDGHPATSEFVGIRSLSALFHFTEANEPRHGDELTFSEYILEDFASVQALAAGDAVRVEITDTHGPTFLNMDEEKGESER